MRSYVLDVTRSLSRVGMGAATGIDRVEAAYIRHLLAANQPHYFLARVAGGFVLLDRNGMEKLNPVLQGRQPPGKQDLTALLYRKVAPMAARAQSDSRRFSMAHAPRIGLARMLAASVPPGFAYLNVGHSNRQAKLWNAVRNGGAGQCLAMLHDTIPLDWPQFGREGQAETFADNLRATFAGASTIICNSDDTKSHAQRWLDEWDMQARLITVPIGCDQLSTPFAEFISTPRPEFVVLGTIEPRKNHALLLDVWSQLAGDSTQPELHIIGQRGWRNEAVFARLDRDPMMGNCVFEHGALDDRAVASRLQRARALLFPSFAEGFGYPLVEALQLGVPVICSDLPVFRALAGSAATYLPPDNAADWLDAIRNCSQIAPTRPAKIDFPSWDSHFSFIDDYVHNYFKR